MFDYYPYLLFSFPLQICNVFLVHIKTFFSFLSCECNTEQCCRLLCQFWSGAKAFHVLESKFKGAKWCVVSVLVFRSDVWWLEPCMSCHSVVSRNIMTHCLSPPIKWVLATYCLVYCHSGEVLFYLFLCDMYPSTLFAICKNSPAPQLWEYINFFAALSFPMSYRLPHLPNPTHKSKLGLH